MYPKTYYKLRPPQVQRGMCFVLMPFAENFTEVYEIIKEALQGPEINFTCKRADELEGGGHVIEDILRLIGEAELVLADLTGRNPNVFYELGIAHMQKELDQVILLTQEIESVPFDLKIFRCIPYKQTITGGRKLREDLIAAVRAVTQPSFRFSVSEGKKFTFEHRLMGDDNCLYSFAIVGDYFGLNGTKFTVEVTQFVAGQKPRQCRSMGMGMVVGGSEEMPCIPWNLRLEDVAENSVAKFVLVHR